MFSFKFLSFSPLLKHARNGDKSKVRQLADQGEQDTFIVNQLHEQENEWQIKWCEWKWHVYAWMNYVEALVLLSESHKKSFEDETLNQRVLHRVLTSLKLQPSSAALVVFAYLHFLIERYDRVTFWLSQAKELDPFNKDVDTLLHLVQMRSNIKSQSSALQNSLHSSKLDFSYNIKEGSSMEFLGGKKEIVETKTSFKQVPSYYIGPQLDPTLVLPDEIMLIILSYLAVPDLGSISQVSSSFRKLANDFVLWRTLYFSHFVLDQSELQGMETQSLDFKNLYKDVHTLSKNWRYGDCVTTALSGHTGAVNYARFDADKVISCGDDRTIRLWNINSKTDSSEHYSEDFGKCYDILEGHTEAVTALCFSEDQLFTGSINCMKMWSIHNGESLHTFEEGVDGPVFCMDLNGHLLATGVMDAILLWNVDVDSDLLFGERNEMIGHLHNINCIKFLPDNNKLITASDDLSARLWDIHANKNVITLLGHKKAVSCAQIDHPMVVTGSLDSTLRFYDIRLQRCLETLSCAQSGGPIVDIQFNEYHIVTGHLNGSVGHWDIRYTKWHLQNFAAHSGRITSLQFDNNKLVTSSVDGTVRIWNFKIAQQPQMRGSRSQVVSTYQPNSFLCGASFSENPQSQTCSIL